MATATTTVPLHLSSPPMEGGDVAQAQRLLLHNTFGTFDPGPIDGVYGERTAAAVRRAKYWLGYPERQIDEIASPDLVAMLAGGVPQPPSFKASHTRRLRRAQDVGLWNSAYDVAISNVGERETPAGSRRIECTDWYGVPAPWAAIFVSWCYARAGSAAFQAGGRYAYVPHMLWDAQRGVNQPLGHPPPASRATCRCSTSTATASPTTSRCSTTGPASPAPRSARSRATSRRPASRTAAASPSSSAAPTTA